MVLSNGRNNDTALGQTEAQNGNFYQQIIKKKM